MIPEVLGPIRDVFAEPARRMVSNSAQPKMVTEDSVYQIANVENRRIIEDVLDQLVLPGSGITGVEHLVDLHHRSLAGESCLVPRGRYNGREY